jgi:hypothetical protein
MSELRVNAASQPLILVAAALSHFRLSKSSAGS